ncbi:MAG: hypothetical protein KJ709_06375 [Nanoarchaeota archaeon]|nr:hypothetical protein [Nanoarchaeota archaeon]
MREEHKDVAPIFVKIDEYKEIIEIINSIKGKLDEGRATIKKIEELKSHEEAELDQWRNELDEVQRKMSFIDKTLFEPEGL